MVARLLDELCSETTAAEGLKNSPVQIWAESGVSKSVPLVRAEDVPFVWGEAEVADHPVSLVLLTLDPASLMGPGMLKLEESEPTGVNA